MAVDRLLPTEEAADLIALVRDIGDAELRPRVDADERAGRFPRDVFATLGKAGLLSLPFPERYGGAAQPYEVYLQVLEEIGARWASVGVGVSVQALTCFPLPTTAPSSSASGGCRSCWAATCWGILPLRAGRRQRPGGDADPGHPHRHGWRIDGTKAWVTHGGQADFYTVLARTGEGSRGISCFLVPAGAPGLSGRAGAEDGPDRVPRPPPMHFDGVEIDARPADRGRRARGCRSR